MSHREDFNPGPANLARIEKSEGEMWTLVLVKELFHPPERVWEALTDPEQLREWSPFDSDKNLGSAGTTATLTTVGAPAETVSQTTVTRAEAPKVLEYQWGGSDVRWELEAMDQGTRLTLWTSINRKYMAMGAAGWQVCLGVLNLLLEGDPVGRIVSKDALQFEGWQRLNREYSELFKVGVEAPEW